MVYTLLSTVFKLYNPEWCILYFQQYYSYITQNGVYSTFNSIQVIKPRMMYTLLSTVFKLYNPEWCILYFQQYSSYITHNGVYSIFNSIQVI